MSTTVSGHVALEFANTVDNYRLAEPHDFIPDLPSLVDFSVRVGVITRKEGEQLQHAGALDAGRGADLMGEARALRGVIYRLFSELAHGRPAPEEDLESLNRRLSLSSVHARVLLQPDGFSWGWEGAPDDLGRLLWPLTAAAAELLTSPNLERLRQCDGHNCTWMFLDQSKNRSRRWCSMDICGNRAKSRRHYARQRTT